MKNPSYEMKLKSKTDRGKDIYNFVSADGVLGKNSFRDGELALADTVEPELDEDILVVQSGYGFLPVIMSDQAPEGEILAAETSDRAYQLTQLNLKENDAENAIAKKVAFYNEINQNFDKVVYAPEGYEPVKVVKNRISHLTELLNDEGQLFIAGKKTDGINRYKKYLSSLPGKNQKITQDGKQRVYRYTKTESFEPDSFDIETKFTVGINGIELEFAACEGLFSPNNLDDGSRLLIENLELSEEDKVLDLACGYGIIGVFVKALYNSEIYLTDDSKTTTYYAEKNLKSNGVQNFILKNKDCLDGFTNQKFDAIVSNPPTHQGEAVTNEMFNQSYQSLRQGGQLYIVYNQNMKYEEKLQKKFSEVEILEKENNYTVTRATK
jgi:16S rRNA G1207 methylase RsmC